MTRADSSQTERGCLVGPAPEGCALNAGPLPGPVACAACGASVEPRGCARHGRQDCDDCFMEACGGSEYAPRPRRANDVVRVGDPAMPVTIEGLPRRWAETLVRACEAERDRGRYREVLKDVASFAGHANPLIDRIGRMALEALEVES